MSENFGSEERDKLVVKLRNRITELEAQLDDGRRTVKECHELAAKRISSLEKALETIADEYQCQVGFDEYYDNAMDVFYGRGEA